MVYQNLVNEIFSCFFLGGLTLILDDDDGIYINECLGLYDQYNINHMEYKTKYDKKLDEWINLKE